MHRREYGRCPNGAVTAGVVCVLLAVTLAACGGRTRFNRGDASDTGP
jgi:hypothetical protein